LIKMDGIMDSPKRLARSAGALYLLVAILGTFAMLFVDKQVYVAGDAATTAGNLVADAGLVRSGVAADLIQATLWVFVAMTLYLLLKHVSKSAASAMVVLAAIGAGITMLNGVFRFESMRVATGEVGAASDSLALLLLDTQHYGVLIAQVFFGLWLVPMGYLVYKSGWFPKALGVLLIVGGASYLVDTFALFLIPGFGEAISAYVVIPAVIAEVWMVGYLLVIGVRTAKPIAVARPERECGAPGQPACELT
jgi:hypothetical protein